MKRWMTPLATLAGIAVMVACASAQEAPVPVQGDASHPSDKQAQKPVPAKKKGAPDQTKKADAATGDQAKDKKSEEADDSEPKQLYNSLTLGFNTWNSSGNNSTMNQNLMVPGGYSIADLSILRPFDRGSFYSFDLKGNPGQDYGANLTSQWGAQSSLVVNSHQFSYFDPSFGTISPSRNKSIDATYDQQFAQNFGAFATIKVDQNNHEFAAPITAVDYTNRTVAVGTQKQVGQNTLSATYVENSFTDNTQTQPTTLTDRGQLRYMGNFGPRFSATGTVALTRIEQQGGPDSWIRDASLSGVYDVTEDSTIGGHFGEQDLDLNSIQNAYVRRKLDSGIRYDSRLGTWGYGFGFSHREEERVRSDHSYVDVPEWNTYDFKLNGRLNKELRFGLKGSIEDLSSAPVFLTDDPTLLYWSRKEDIQAKLSGGNEDTTGYLSYTLRHRVNSQREVSIDWSNVSIGGSRVFGSNLLGYAEMATDQYSTGGNNPLAPAIGSYFAASETFMFGLDYTKSTRENLSLVLTNFYTEDQWGQQVALSYHLDLGKDRNFQITYSPWLQRDRLYDVDTFTAPILTVKVGCRF